MSVCLCVLAALALALLVAATVSNPANAARSQRFLHTLTSILKKASISAFLFQLVIPGNSIMSWEKQQEVTPTSWWIKAQKKKQLDAAEDRIKNAPWCSRRFTLTWIWQPHAVFSGIVTHLLPCGVLHNRQVLASFYQATLAAKERTRSDPLTSNALYQRRSCCSFHKWLILCVRFVFPAVMWLLQPCVHIPCALSA